MATVQKNGIDVDLSRLSNLNNTIEILDNIFMGVDKNATQVVISVEELRELRRVALLYKESLLKTIQEKQRELNENELRSIQNVDKSNMGSFVKASLDKREIALENYLEEGRSK